MQLDDRMKQYEYVSRTYLTRRLPVIIRIDGKAFHSFTKGFNKPFDDIFCSAMQQTMKYLCENIQGCVLGYTQSDEITLVLTDYQNRDTEAWFGNNIQKMASVSASMATLKFNRVFNEAVNDWYYLNRNGFSEESEKMFQIYVKAIKKGAMFDSRVFTLPKEEVVNCLIWRQQDAIRNSIEALGQAHFSAKELHGKNCKDIQGMLLAEKNINWLELPIFLQRGSCCIKKEVIVEIEREVDSETIFTAITRNKWVMDDNIPLFVEDRDYVNLLL